VAESVVLPPEKWEYEAMPSYCIYKLANNNHIAGVPEVVKYDSDEDVAKYAKETLDGHDVEVWDGPRVVIRLKSPPPDTPPQLAASLLQQF
jgi:hypothetical protein